MSHQQTIISWLNNAYALERELIVLLEGQLDDAEGFPDMQKKIQQHIEETQNHANMVQECIEQLGGEVSQVKTKVGEMMGIAKGVVAEVPGDKVIKDAIANYAVENFEIASYTVLLEAVSELGEATVSDKITRILEDEKDMATWLYEHLPSVTEKFLAQKKSEHD